LTVPVVLLLAAAVASLLPLLFVAAAGADLVRGARGRGLAGRSRPTLRALAFLVVYLAFEILGLAALGLAWLGAGLGPGRAARLIAATYRIQAAWAGGLLTAVRRVYSLRFEVEGAEAAAPGPVILLVRHASIVDTLIPTALVGAGRGLRLRFVLKRELLWEPCLDVAGNRLPNHFVDREAPDGRAELEAIRALAAGMGPLEGALIYPEGTRFTEEKRRRALERIAASAPELRERAAAFRRVMPPRPGGTLALLEGCPAADVVVLAHHGLDGLARMADIWSGSLTGRTVAVALRRIPRAAIPTGRAAQIDWLFETWRTLDDWVAARDGGAA